MIFVLLPHASLKYFACHGFTRAADDGPMLANNTMLSPCLHFAGATFHLYTFMSILRYDSASRD